MGGMVRRTAKTAADRVVWIGGLKERETKKDADLNKALQTFINKFAPGCKFVDIGPKGSGGAIFGSEDEAAAAMSALQGKKFQDCQLIIDSYVKGWKGEE